MVSVLKEMIMTSSVTPRTPAPASTSMAVRATWAHLSANGVIASTIAGSWATSTTSTAPNTRDMMNGGIAPSQNSLGRWVRMRPPRSSRAAPPTASEIRFAMAVSRPHPRCDGSWPPWPQP